MLDHCSFAVNMLSTRQECTLLSVRMHGILHLMLDHCGLAVGTYFDSSSYAWSLRLDRRSA